MTATIPAAQQVDANGRTIDAYGPSVITTQVLQNAANGTSNGADFDITGSATLQLLVTPAGSYTGTVTFNASPDGTNFDVIQGNQQGTSTLATSVVCSGNTLTIWTFQVSGLKTFRASIAGDSTSAHVVTVVAWASNVPIVSPLAATITSTVLGAGSNVIGKAIIEATSGVALTADQTNSILRTSLYGKASAAGDTAILTDTFGNVAVAPYPPGATPLTAASGNVAAGTAAATLAKATGKTTYITGFEVTGAGATGAAVVSVTVVGTLGGTLTYTYAAVAGATLINTPLIVQFPIPIPSSAANTDIVVSCPTLGTGNLNNTVVAHGYRL